ncbi:hypothetical protein D3C78_1579060 [compost metagenome]
MGIGVEDQRLAQCNVGYHDVVKPQLAAGLVGLGVDVYTVFQGGKAGAGPLVGQLYFVGSPDQPRLLVHPHQGSFELVGYLQRLVGACEHVAP